MCCVLSIYNLFLLDVNHLDVNIFLGPFLEVIRSEDTTGPITGVALSSINKFLSYGLLGECSIPSILFVELKISKCVFQWSMKCCS